MPLAPGTLVGTYRLVEQLGRGGQGAVWKCADPTDPSRFRALKIIRLGDASEADVERVRREGRLLATLQHPSLVACQGIVEDVDAGVIALLMDLVEGETLNHAMQDRRFSQRKREAVLDHIAAALAFLHQSGVVHRDVKLENVMLRSRFWQSPGDPRTVKLVDFGIAVLQGNPHRLTKTGTVVGTLAYLAPELLDPNRWPASPSQATSDVFAFGVLGWILLTGAHPTGLAPSATITDLARVYDGVGRNRCPWPGSAPGGRWGPALPGCLVLAPAQRLANGDAILRAGAESGAVPRAQPVGDPVLEWLTALKVSLLPSIVPRQPAAHAHPPRPRALRRPHTGLIIIAVAISALVILAMGYAALCHSPSPPHQSVEPPTPATPTTPRRSKRPSQR